MTKFTIEDLRDIAYRGSYDDLERELALQLLASMEQAPVYLRPFGDDGETFVACDGNDERAITLYAAPQLPQPAVVDEHYQHLNELYHAQEKRLFKIAQRIKGPSFDKYAYSPSQAIDVLESAIFGEREDDGRAAMLQGDKS